MSREVGHGFCVGFEGKGAPERAFVVRWSLGRDVCDYDSELCPQACFSKLS